MSMTHAIAHLLHWNYGYADAYYQEGKLMMSFVCTGCRKRSGVHECDEVVSREFRESLVSFKK